MEAQAEIEPDPNICHSKSITHGIYVQANSCSPSTSPTMRTTDDLEVELEVEDEDPLELDYEYGLEEVVRIKEERIVAEDEEGGSESEEPGASIGIKSGKTTSFPRPKLISKVDLMDMQYCSFQNRSYCSNCYAKLSCDNQGKKFADILCRRKGKSEMGSVTVLEALDVIFEVNKNSFLSEIILDETEYSFCLKCCCILSKLYKLYVEFADCSRSPSYIKSIITHNRPLHDHQDSIKGPTTSYQKTDEENEFNEYDESESFLNFEIDFQEEEDSYYPPSGTRSRTPRSNKSVSPSDNTAATRSSRKRPLSSVEASVEVETAAGPPVKRGRGRPRKVPLPLNNIPVKTEAIKSSPESKRKPDPRREKDRRLIYKCSECSARFSRPSRLKRHLNVHSGRKYVCGVCNAGFNFAIYLERHEATHSTSGNADGGESDSDSGEKKVGEGKMKLSTAGGNLSREERRRAHVCRDCGLVFTKPSGLLRHSRIHENVTYACDQPECSSEFTSKRLLIRHRIKDHLLSSTQGESGDTKPYMGSVIRRRLQKENEDLYIRLDGNKDTRRYQCPDCPQAFYRTDHIRRHARVHTEKNHVCEVCEAGFSMMKHLITHKKVAHSEGIERTKVRRTKISRAPIRTKRYTCPEADCDYTFSRTNHVEEHLRSKHKIEPRPREREVPQTCPVCSLVVKSKARLDTHLQKHRPLIRENNHECDVCGKKYRDANNLRNHKASHRLDKPYICDKCGFATKRSYQLTRHIEMVHVGTRSHLCTDCGQSFKKKQHLRDHEGTHNAMEYRPYTCTMEGCTKAYRSRRNLRQHLEAHTGSKFQCETCGRIFTRKDNLKVHVDTVHLGKPGRTHKEKAKIDGGSSVAKKPRKPKQTDAVENILPDDGPATEDKRIGSTHQVVILDEGNLQQLQQQQQFHHILSSPRIIQQGAGPGQSVVAIPNAFGEYFYTI